MGYSDEFTFRISPFTLVPKLQFGNAIVSETLFHIHRLYEPSARSMVEGSGVCLQGRSQAGVWEREVLRGKRACSSRARQPARAPGLRTPARTATLMKIGIEISVRLCAAILCLVCGPVMALRAADSVCAQVQIQIAQKLTMERTGFEATLQVANGLPSTALENFNVTLLFSDTNGNTVSSTTDPGDAGCVFWYRVQAGSPALPSAVEGGATRTFKWLIIPGAGAGQASPQGTRYFIGATVSYSINGVTQTAQVSPDYVQVYPSPILELEYFLPEQVIGQDPNTPNMFLPPVPFSIGVRIKNAGLGTAKSLNINSGQPQIVSNRQNLAVNFQITGCDIEGRATTPSLLSSFGDLNGGSVAVGRWIMEASLTGKFVSFNASFSHTDALGGAATSLIQNVTTYRLIREVLETLPGSDAIPDFLAYPEGRRDLLYLFPSDMTIVSGPGRDPATEKLPVTDCSGAAALALSANGYTMSFNSLPQGMIFAQVEQPAVSGLVVTAFTRSDGITLPARNAWISATQDIDGSYRWHYYLNLFDHVPATGGFSYNIQLNAPPAANHAPVIQAMADHYLKIGNTHGYLVRATDQDNDMIALASGALPPGATFNPQYTAPAAGTATGLISWTPTAAQAGDYTVRFTASDGQATASQSMGLHVISGSTAQIAAWRGKYWPGISDPSIIGNNANPSGDGYPNLVKYALGADPTRACGTLTEIGTVTVGGTTYLALSYVGRSDDSTLRFAVAASGSVRTPADQWAELPDTNRLDDSLVSQAGVPDGFKRVTIRDVVPVGDPGTAGRFLRLKVTETDGEAMTND